MRGGCQMSFVRNDAESLDASSSSREMLTTRSTNPHGAFAIAIQSSSKENEVEESESVEEETKINAPPEISEIGNSSDPGPSHHCDISHTNQLSQVSSASHASATSQVSHVTSGNGNEIPEASDTTVNFPVEPLSDVSIARRRSMTADVPSRPKSDQSSSSCNSSKLGPMDLEHVDGGSSQMSVTSYNLIRTIRSSCRASKGLLDYSDMMFKEMIKKLELMHTNTRMRISNDIERGKERNEQRFTDISNEIKELKQAVENQSKLLDSQNFNWQTDGNSFTQTTESENALEKDESHDWSRAATKLVRRAASQDADAQDAKPSRIPVPVRVESKYLGRAKSETVGRTRDRSERQQQDVRRSDIKARWRHHYRGSPPKAYHTKQRNKSKERQINIQEHKRGPKLAQYRQK
ncbi:uncharacterized protein LOC121429678 [Lytechinus variegatus]|uniref:uncharacterized protein LOC121429678 n=1 Tax=Lytechinus variegatus TaxID=7654 RepID=UPI001BB17515|nr:uncharacterized protein LOC121429678 [Lytechinus variegatus]